MDKNYDIILAGAGLALEPARRPFFQNKKVLLIDRDAKEKTTAPGDVQLRRYLHEFLKISDFRVAEEEFGVIPMIDYSFEPLVEGLSVAG